jgi:hypothetical protein
MMSFLRGTVHRVTIYQGETDTGSCITRQDGQKGDSVDVKRKDGQLTCPAMPDLKQETNLYVHPLSEARVLWTRKT